MSDVPPDRRATHALYEQLRDAGIRKAQERQPVQQPSRRRTLLPRRRAFGPVVAVALAFALGASGAAIGTRAFIHDEGPVSGDPGAPRDVQHAPGDRRNALAAVADPGRAGAKWGLRIYPNPQGETCLQPGRFMNGQIGAVQGGKFRAYPEDTIGACTDLTQEHASVALWSYRLGDDPRTILYGAVDRTVTGLAVGPAGQERPITIAPDGTYIVVQIGGKRFDGERFVVRRGDETKIITLKNRDVQASG